MNLVTTIQRFTLPLIVLTSPYWLGIPLLKMGVTTLGFILAAILPQIVQNPFGSYYSAQTNQIFSGSAIPAIILWLVVFLVYGFITKTKSLGVSIIIFFTIMVVAVSFVHFSLNIFGYNLVIDSV